MVLFPVTLVTHNSPKPSYFRYKPAL